MNFRDGYILGLSKDGQTMQFFFPYSERNVNLVRSIYGRIYNKHLKCWEFPINPQIYADILMKFPRTLLDINLKNRIRQIAATYDRVNEMKLAGWENAVPNAPMLLKSEKLHQGKPYNHQILAFNVAITLPHFACLMEQGCGKSLVMVALIGHWFRLGEVKRVLIFCPSSVIPVWPSEFADFAKYPVNVFALTETVVERENFLYSLQKSGILEKNIVTAVVTNYEVSWRMQDALTGFKPDMVICDESQRIKNGSSEQAKAIYKISENARHRAICSGTPIEKPVDYFGQYRFLDPNILGYYFTTFRNRYAHVAGEHDIIVGYKNLDELTRKVHQIAFRVTKKDALPDMPEKVDQILYFELEKEARKIYDQMEADSIAEIAGYETITANNILAKMLRLSQLTGGFFNANKLSGADDDGSNPKLIKQVSKAKLKLLDETLTDLLDQNHKVVVFTRFTPEFLAICDLMAKNKIKFVSMNGNTPASLKKANVDQFQKDPETMVMVANIRCAGLGITLHAAHYAIFYSFGYSLIDYEQAKDRLHRIGQRDLCTYIHLVAQHTIDVKIVRALQNKREIAKEVVDDWRQYFEDAG